MPQLSVPHTNWKLYRLITGNGLEVRSLAFGPNNSWFCAGSEDGSIRIIDLASGRIKLTLTGHIGQVRGVAVSSRPNYMYSAGLDGQVKCWDLEQNKVIRNYDGHLSGIYCLSLLRDDNYLITGGRDCVSRVWDVRTRNQELVLSGHTGTVCSVLTRGSDPEVVTGSNDSTIKFWDLRYGKSDFLTLTHHKKTVRALALNLTEKDCFVSASNEIKKFSFPNGEFLQNIVPEPEAITNAIDISNDGVMASGSHDGSLNLWDWRSGVNFQKMPGLLDSEAGICTLSFDRMGSRLIVCGTDRMIQMWKPDPEI
ncbi:protein pleiotropic regulatory locus 1-like [Mercurialis annua]|uniref:protein pleiotropic regulatory locus 1-like n=1 Tax=Mercurialis annua TaxID=3986 RepID=UPI0021607919|nr:protein pleiotropic regulatory locus 1-like [Mercurialis annua]